jgi:hypothetical protein
MPLLVHLSGAIQWYFEVLVEQHAFSNSQKDGQVFPGGFDDFE